MGLIREQAPQDLERVLARYPTRQAALMPVLYLAQQLYGHLSEEAIDEVADLLGLSHTQVEAVIRFYTLYYLEPMGKYVIDFCNDMPCALRGADRLLRELEEELGIGVGATSADGLFTLRTVMCVAACHRAPVMQVNLEYYEDLDLERAREVLNELRQQAAAPAEPAEVAEAPAGRTGPDARHRAPGGPTQELPGA